MSQYKTAAEVPMPNRGEHYAHVPFTAALYGVCPALSGK